MLARDRRGHDEFGMGGRGRADRDGVDRRIGEEFQRFSVDLRRVEALRGGWHGVGDGRQSDTGKSIGKGGGVEAADPSGTDEAD